MVTAPNTHRENNNNEREGSVLQNIDIDVPEFIKLKEGDRQSLIEDYANFY